MFDVENIKQAYARMSKQMKDFLLSDKSREFFIFLFFFFVAGGFWLLQTLNADYETEFSVPVRLRNVPDNVVITSEPVSKLQVRVKDKGTVLLNYMLGRSFYPVTVDFSDYKNSKDNVIEILSSRFSKSITSQLKNSTQLLSVKPDTLEYIYSTGVSKKVPVSLQGEVRAGREYYFPDTIFEPDSVLMYAPQSILDTIHTAYTEYVNLQEVSDTLVKQLSLDRRKGVKFIPSTIQMTLPVDIYTEKTVDVPLRGVNFPPDKALRAFPSKIKVTFQVGVSRFRDITADDFHINVSYEELLKLGSSKYTVRLRSIPEGVSNVRFTPEQVDFIIEQVTPDYGY